MRKEADDVGPKAELDHWKKRMAKFNSLLDQVKGPECKAVVGVLHAAKSKLLKVCLFFYAVLEGSRGVNNATLFTIENKTRDRSSLVKDGKDGNGSNHNFLFFQVITLACSFKAMAKNPL